MYDQLTIERHYANGNVIIDNCAYCDIYPNAFDDNGLERLHIEPGDDDVYISKSNPNIIPKKSFLMVLRLLLCGQMEQKRL